MSSIEPYVDFPSAARAVLALLHQRLGFNLWMVTRTEGKDWIVLQSEDHGYGVKDGSTFNWEDSYCSQMVLGHGPNIAPSSADVPAYKGAPINANLTIKAYIGLPLMRADGTLFGTLCAIDPLQKPPEIKAELPLIETLARMLCTILDVTMRADEEARRADAARAEAQTDALTGVYNRRGWEVLLAAEENRCTRYGHPACILSIDFDGLKRINDKEGHAKGDDLIRAGAAAIRRAVREKDIVARLGGDEFAVLGVECGGSHATHLKARVESALSDAGVEASVGLALRDPSNGFRHAIELAEKEMYACKRGRKNSR